MQRAESYCGETQNGKHSLVISVVLKGEWRRGYKDYHKGSYGAYDRDPLSRSPL